MTAKRAFEFRRVQQANRRGPKHCTVILARAQHLGVHEPLIDIHQGPLEMQAQRIGAVGIDQGIEKENG
ncbi:MAG: hypothetical protein JO237_01875 [Pseudolabrys sp.]|nr:hypothetical protein [Pseudolabrys sp.]